jgi:large subunit ribosomal protein L9
VKQIEQERAALLKKEAKEKSSAEMQASEMRKIALNFERRAGEQGALYGSVTSMDIAEALRERGFEVDRRRINLREAIKETGEFKVPVRLHREVVVELPVTVTGAGAAGSSGNAPQQADAAPPNEREANINAQNKPLVGEEAAS